MARTTNEFGGGEIVPAIEAITGIQAPVMAEFVSALSTTGTNPTLVAADITALQAMTVNNEHGQRRSIQNPKNNLKNSSGIERIPFNGINELDTETGSNLATTPLFNQSVHALNTGDSRIRFVGNGWLINANNDGTDVRTDILNDYVEITFFGTGLNLLGRIDTGSNWSAVVDGGTAFNILPTTGTIATGVFNGRNVKPNTIIPVIKGLAPGIHTIRVSRANTNTLFLNGCEIINENPVIPMTTTEAITTHPGADFDGRVTVTTTEAASGLPIEPTVATAGTAYRVNSSDTKTGARVLNYTTSGGQLKQVFTDANADLVEVGGGTGTTYTVQLSTPGTTGTLTIPTSASSVRVITFGGGGSGGNVGGGGSGGGGGGGARAEVVYTRDSGNTSTLALTSSIGAANGSTTASLAGTLVATAGGANSANGFSAGAGGTPTIPAADPGITGWTRISTTEFNGSAGNTAGGGAGAEAGGVGGNTGGGLAGRRGLIPLFPLTETSEIAGRAEGSGGGQTSVGDPLSTVQGAIPGGGGSGNTANDNPIQGTGARGETYIIFSADDSLTITTNGTVSSIASSPVGSARQKFSLTNHVEQEVIRRINFREFGANNNFATLAATGNQTAAFTLDDGTTTLAGFSVVGGTISTGVDRMSISATGGGFVLTFVGTGLDIFEGGIDGGTTVGSPQNVIVDGFNIGAYTPSTLPQITPIVSGLSYGTHTVRFLIPSTGANINPNVVDFIIYGPKKPEIPTIDAGSVELSDYNIMGDYSRTDDNRNGGQGLGNQNSVSRGVMRKPARREFLYSGSVSLGSIAQVSVNGRPVNFNQTGVASYTFYGTGCELYVSNRGSADTVNCTVQLDGTALGTGPTNSSIDTVPASRYTSSTSTWDAASNFVNNASETASRLQISGLQLGVHTIEITNTNTTALTALFSGIDVITPIHINDSNLKLGSEGLNNLTIDPVVEEDEAVVLANLGEAKAWVNYDPLNSIIKGSFNVSAVIETTTNRSQAQIFFDKPFKDDSYVALSQIVATSPGSNNSIIANTFQQANFCRIQTENSGDTFGYSVAFFGELIDE